MSGDILIVGGGLAGAAAALGLVRAGRHVHVLERQPEPAPKICGEFLSIEAQQHLAMLGIDLDAMGAPAITRLRLLWDGTRVEADLPFVARGIGRTLLDEALLERAAQAGATIERGVRATRMAGRRIHSNAGERHAETLILATGKLPVRDEGAAPKSLPSNAHAGFKMHWRMKPTALDDAIELTLFPGGYAGLQRVAADTANLCVAIRKDRLIALGGQWPDVLAMLAARSPAIRRLVDEGEPLLPRPVTIANLPYGHRHAGHPEECAYRIGDQAAMTASLTGDGMAIALRSAWAAVRHIQDGVPPTLHHNRLRAMVGRQVRMGLALQSVSESPLLGPVGRAALALWPGILPHLTRITRLPELAPCDA